MTRYGRTDPSAFQLRDLHRRVTKAEAAGERTNLRFSRLLETVMKTINDTLSVQEGTITELVEVTDDLYQKIDVLKGRVDRLRQGMSDIGEHID